MTDLVFKAKNIDKFSWFLKIFINFARDIHVAESPEGKQEGVDFMEMGVYLAPVFDMS